MDQKTEKSLCHLNDFLSKSHLPIIFYVGRGNKKGTSEYELEHVEHECILTFDIVEKYEPSYTLNLDDLNVLKHIKPKSVSKIIFDLEVIKFFGTAKNFPLDWLTHLQNLLIDGGILCLSPSGQIPTISPDDDPHFTFYSYSRPVKFEDECDMRILERIKKELDPDFSWDAYLDACVSNEPWVGKFIPQGDLSESMNHNSNKFKTKVDSISDQEKKSLVNYQVQHEEFVVQFLKDTRLFSSVEKFYEQKYPYYKTKLFRETLDSESMSLKSMTSNLNTKPIPQGKTFYIAKK
jgi:hypothetical protein